MIDPSYQSRLARIEPDDRLVVLARIIHTQESQAETALKDSIVNWTRFGEACVGQALYRHRSIYHNASQAPVWSHVELSYFHNLVPVDAILDLVVRPRPTETRLLRAEILLTTPSSFVLPSNWQGSADRPDRQVSLEYIKVHSPLLGEYRDVMRDFCGPAATKLVRANKFGTFRAMETATVLYHDPELRIDWNQIHLCELDTGCFDGFGREFEAALREDSPDNTDIEGTFAGLDRMRTVPRWTYNDPLVEEDAAVVREGKLEP